MDFLVFFHTFSIMDGEGFTQNRAWMMLNGLEFDRVGMCGLEEQ